MIANKMSFKSKLFITYVILITIPIIFGGTYIYKELWHILNRQATDMITQRLKNETININLALDDIENVAYNLSVNSSFTKFIKESANYSDIDFVKNYNNKIYPLFTWINSTNNNIQDLNLFTYNKNIHEVSIFHWIEKFKNDKWLKNVINKVYLGSAYWEPCHISRDYLNLKEDKNYVYSLFYVMNPYDSINKTYLELEINTKNLLAPVLYTPIGKEGYVSVLDTEGNITSNKSDEMLNTLKNDKDFISKLKDNEGQYVYTFNNVSYCIYFNKIKRLNTYLIGIIPAREISELLLKPRNSYIILLLTTYIILLLIAFNFGNLLTTKIRKIEKAIHKVQDGDFNIKIPVNSDDELDKLASDFNIMAFKINELINKVYKTEIAQKQAELFALQAQIRPHFIYNTLESLRMLAELQDQNDVSEGLEALGNLMKQNNNIGNNLINIKSEIQNISNYIKVQNITHNNKIKVQYDAKEDVKEYKILNLTLQPLVENCIIHGFDSLKQYLEINIKINKVGDNVYCIVKDNGRGIISARLKLLKCILNGEMEEELIQSDEDGIGLINVNKRIELYFGEQYGVKIESKQKEGTTVTVKIPLLL